MNRRIIGGEFELSELPIGQQSQAHPLTHDLAGAWTTSGRSALFLILKALQKQGVNHIHLPAYLCTSILLPIKALGFSYSFYPVDQNLTAYPDPPEGAAVFLIHYFGWPNLVVSQSDIQVSHVLIEDASQAMLSGFLLQNCDRNFVLFTPRKFGPVGFGGWCNVAADVGQASQVVETLAWRSVAARLVRGAYLQKPDEPVDAAIESVYLNAFQAVEDFLDIHPEAQQVPDIVKDVISGIDWQAVALRRRQNWLVLHDALNGSVKPIFDMLPDDVTPLGYVVQLEDRDQVRKALRDHRIFCPVHWPLPEDVDGQKFLDAKLLSDRCLTLPIDQRYDREDMLFLANTLRSVIRAL